MTMMVTTMMMIMMMTTMITMMDIFIRLFRRETFSVQYMSLFSFVALSSMISEWGEQKNNEFYKYKTVIYV